MASSAPTCPFEGSPPLNTDIAGIGIRVSTYVQAFLSIITMTVSPSLTEIYSQAFPYIIMNISVTVAALALGFSSDPQITLQDATVAWYFTVIPLIIHIIKGKTLATRRKRYNAINMSYWDTISHLVSMSIMYILSATFTLAVFRHHATFGSHPECNDAARIFLFGTHKISHRWFVTMAVVYALILAVMFIPIIFFLGFMCVLSMKPMANEERREVKRQRRADQLIAQANAKRDFRADYRIPIIGFILLVVWIAFTELTVAKNQFAPQEGSSIWQFGQIFPLIILAVPLLATVKAVVEFVNNSKGRGEESARDGDHGGRDGRVENVNKVLDVPQKEEIEENGPFSRNV